MGTSFADPLHEANPYGLLRAPYVGCGVCVLVIKQSICVWYAHAKACAMWRICRLGQNSMMPWVSQGEASGVLHVGYLTSWLEPPLLKPWRRFEAVGARYVSWYGLSATLHWTTSFPASHSEALTNTKDKAPQHIAQISQKIGRVVGRMLGTIATTPQRLVQCNVGQTICSNRFVAL